MSSNPTTRDAVGNREAPTRRETDPARAAHGEPMDETGVVTVSDPPWAFALLNTTRFAWLWLIIRVYVGWQWLTSGWGKFNNPAWWSGDALAGFWGRAVEVPADGRPAITYDWYRTFIQFMLDNQWYTWFGKVIMFGELAIGLALILGALVGIAAFFGGFLNWNFIMAGSASSNGLLFALAIALVLAWKVAGWYGLDRYLLPLLGTPWERVPRGALHRTRRSSQTDAHSPAV